jgi:hypothetical protein
MLASVAAMLNALLGGFSRDVPTYLVSTLFFGVEVAFVSGTYETILYDTLNGLCTLRAALRDAGSASRRLSRRVDGGRGGAAGRYAPRHSRNGPGLQRSTTGGGLTAMLQCLDIPITVA